MFKIQLQCSVVYMVSLPHFQTYPQSWCFLLWSTTSHHKGPSLGQWSRGLGLKLMFPRAARQKPPRLLCKELQGPRGLSQPLEVAWPGFLGRKKPRYFWENPWKSMVSYFFPLVIQIGLNRFESSDQSIARIKFSSLFWRHINWWVRLQARTTSNCIFSQNHTVLGTFHVVKFWGFNVTTP